MSRSLYWREPPSQREEHSLSFMTLKAWFADPTPPLNEPIVMEGDRYTIGYLHGMSAMLREDDEDRKDIEALIAGLIKFGKVELIIRN